MFSKIIIFHSNQKSHLTNLDDLATSVKRLYSFSKVFSFAAVSVNKKYTLRTWCLQHKILQRCNQRTETQEQLKVFYYSALISATDSAARIFLPRYTAAWSEWWHVSGCDSNPRWLSCTRLGPLKDTLPTELQRRSNSNLKMKSASEKLNSFLTIWPKKNLDTWCQMI